MELLIDLTGRGEKLLDWQPGDVIVAFPDGHDWTPTERTNPRWKILKCPEMSEAEAASLTAPELPKDLKAATQLQRRQFKVDIAALQTKVDVSKAVPLVEIRAVATLKDALPGKTVK